MLTAKQYELLVYIDGYLSQRGISPSFDEMKEALNLKSKSGVHRLITALEERGFLARLPHRARALEVRRRPENMVRGGRRPAEPGSNVSQVVDGRFGDETATRPVHASENVVEVPLYGRIAAGTPIEALRDPSRTLGVPESLLGQGAHYALEVNGDSMIDAGIHDGDIAIVRRTETAENGDIVVALLKDEVTLKRFRRRRDSIALEPANPAHETRIFGPDQVRIQGRLTALYRRY